MKYRITHTTTYNYSQAVGLCQNEARLQPRDYWRQYCETSHLEITPTPMDFRELVDFFGNRLVYFAIQQPHRQLVVTAVSEVSLFPGQQGNAPAPQISWQQARDLIQSIYSQDLTRQQMQALLDAKQYVLDSPMITATAELADYARPSFQFGRPLMDVVADLTQRIYHDFIYDPAFTTIATPLSDVLEHRRGVCQDFAHLAIACLRSFGIPARYISGYMETLPLPGKPRLVGADASHAWFAVYVPEFGWVDFDPTNNKMPHDQHITLAWGRDYADVTPLKGIAFGGGHHTLSVSVDVLRLDGEG
ncbi:MAG: transglutaminase family protein [Methylovulum sp.]|uniref:transglutaminase family protein n=1 Tax=Methylovulum sp. TaxID=1916980 RepID=UPI00261F24C3|nr:transglutaminase family protein [Methylovulum sp.]MDD2725055.1 transglutaminase family protein [Methylovulum sp.]MDD5125933.1 transglutaminase family protein [Methylovulum sp.]